MRENHRDLIHSDQVGLSNLEENNSIDLPSYTELRGLMIPFSMSVMYALHTSSDSGINIGLK